MLISFCYEMMKMEEEEFLAFATYSHGVWGIENDVKNTEWVAESSLLIFQITTSYHASTQHDEEENDRKIV